MKICGIINLCMVMFIGIISGMEDVCVTKKQGQDSRNLSHVARQNSHSFADESDSDKGVGGEKQPPYHDECGRSMLRYSMPHRIVAYRAISRVLDKKCTDPNSWDIRQWTPLHIATSNGLVSVVKWCLKNGADVNARNDIGQTPVHIAVLAKNLQILKLLLDTKDVEINARDGKGWTPLHVALFNKRSEEADLLWEDGADLWAKTSDGYLALDIAVLRSPHMVGILLDSMRQKRKLPQEWTDLHIAAYLGNEAAIKFLVNDKGMDLFAKDSNGHMPSDVARDEVIKQFLIELQINDSALISESSSEAQTPVVVATNLAN